MDNFNISNYEIFFIVLLIFTLFLPFKLLNKNNKLSFAHPLIIYSLLMLFFTVLSPIYQIASNTTNFRGLDFRAQYILGWKGALLSAKFQFYLVTQ